MLSGAVLAKHNTTSLTFPRHYLLGRRWSLLSSLPAANALGTPLPAAVLGGCISRQACCPTEAFCADASPLGTGVSRAVVHPAAGSLLQKGLRVKALAKGSLVPLPLETCLILLGYGLILLLCFSHSGCVFHSCICLSCSDYNSVTTAAI